MHNPSEVTIPWRAWSGGEDTALGRLAEQVYGQLHLMGRRYMKTKRQGNTLQASALVHEVHLRLADPARAKRARKLAHASGGQA